MNFDATKLFRSIFLFCRMHPLSLVYLMQFWVDQYASLIHVNKNVHNIFIGFCLLNYNLVGGLMFQAKLWHLKSKFSGLKNLVEEMLVLNEITILRKVLCHWSRFILVLTANMYSRNCFGWNLFFLAPSVLNVDYIELCFWTWWNSMNSLSPLILNIRKIDKIY